MSGDLPAARQLQVDIGHTIARAAETGVQPADVVFVLARCLGFAIGVAGHDDALTARMTAAALRLVVDTIARERDSETPPPGVTVQ